jgi:hypothetical protein
MTDDKHPVLSTKGQREAEDRRRRQAEALRANLARRKARTRALADDASPVDGADEAPAGESE